MGPDRGKTKCLNSFLNLLLIFLLNSLLNNNNFVGAELRAKGSPHGVIQVKAGKSIGMPPAFASSPLSLWCQAVIKNHPEPIKLINATFTSSKKITYRAEIMADGVTANLTEAKIPVTDAGKWKCEVTTFDGKQAVGFIDVFLRPIVYSRQAIRVDSHETSTFHFSASGITILEGEDTQLTCPVAGYPKPKVHWRVDGTKIIPNRHYSFNDSTLIIKNVTYALEKTYICVAENDYVDPLTKKDTKFELFLERKLRVKNPMGWIWPLFLILAILVALAVVISICEFFKRNRERKLIITEPDPDDE